MAEQVEVAIESALINRLLALSLSPAFEVALPEVAFATPTPGIGVGWFKADFLPAPALELAVGYSSTNLHQGVFQVTVFYNRGEGELKPRRLAAQLVSWFKRGTRLTKDGFAVEVTRATYPGRLMVDGPWTMIPVTIRYQTFAANV